MHVAEGVSVLNQTLLSPRKCLLHEHCRQADIQSMSGFLGVRLATSQSWLSQVGVCFTLLSHGLSEQAKTPIGQSD